MHRSGKCTCGRRIHFPKDAAAGDAWKCYKCGKTWHYEKDEYTPHLFQQLLGRQVPSWQARSRPPRHSKRGGSSSSHTGDLLTVFVVFIIFMWLIAKLLS